MQDARLAELQGTAAGHLLSLSAAPQMWAAVLNGRHFPLRSQERGSASTPSVMSPDVCAGHSTWHVLRARLTLGSVYFTSVSDSCCSSDSLLRNKMLTV